jgi:hypothetical protein
VGNWSSQPLHEGAEPSTMLACCHARAQCCADVALQAHKCTQSSKCVSFTVSRFAFQQLQQSPWLSLAPPLKAQYSHPKHMYRNIMHSPELT